MPVAFAIVANHKARAPVARADLGRPYVDVSLTTSDGLRLAGWYVPSRNGAAVIAFPGRSGPLRHARMLVRHGYGVLLLDRRGEGASEGDFNARGWGGEPDLHAAIAYLRTRPDVHDGRIGGLGLSVGGELLLQTAARDPGLRAVVSEGAGLRSAAEQKHMPDTPPEPLRWIAPITMETAAGVVLSDHLPADGPRRPHAADRTAARPAHPRDEGQRRRGAQPRLPRTPAARPPRCGRSGTPATPAASPPLRPSTSAASSASSTARSIPPRGELRCQVAAQLPTGDARIRQAASARHARHRSVSWAHGRSPTRSSAVAEDLAVNPLNGPRG